MLVRSFEVVVEDIVEYPTNPPNYDVIFKSKDGAEIHIGYQPYEAIADIALGSKYVISINSRA